MRIIMAKNCTPLLQVAQKFKSKAKKFPSGSTNEFLKEKYLELDKLVVPERYQRDLSCADIVKYGKFNKRFFQALIVASRPDGTHVVIDGQHKSVMAIWSGCVDKVPCMVFEHSKDSSDDECEKIEAEIFYAHNAKRKNPSYVDKMRAGYVFELPEAIQYNNNLSACGLCVDSLGDIDGHRLNGEFNWRQAIKKYELATVMRAVAYAKDLDKVWGKGEVRGDIVYGLSAVIKFLDVASGAINGRKEKVLKFISTDMSKSKPKFWYDGISGSQVDNLIARRIIKSYNALSSTANPQCIPEETLDKYGLKDPTK
jgi:hypothetical protein